MVIGVVSESSRNKTEILSEKVHSIDRERVRKEEEENELKWGVKKGFFVHKGDREEGRKEGKKKRKEKRSEHVSRAKEPSLGFSSDPAGTW